MKDRIATLSRLFLLLLTFIVSVQGSIRHLERDEITGHIGSTREELLAKRERDKIIHGRKLEELKRQLKDGYDSERLRKKIKAYEHKLAYLNQEIDDRHIQRLLDREEMLNEVHRERIVRRSEL